MRMMARVNASIPDELLAQAKAARLNISKLARDAIVEELDRRDKIDALDSYLAELEEEHGPVTPQERAEAESWANEVFGTAGSGRRSA